MLYIQASGAEAPSYQLDWAKRLSPDYNISSVYQSNISVGHTRIPPGPYFVHLYTGNVYRVYKLYTDENQAFIQVSTKLLTATYRGTDYRDM